VNDPVWLTEADVVALLDMPAAIAALDRGLVLEANGEAANMPKTLTAWGGGNTLHAIGASFEGAGFAGTKTWAHTKGGAMPLVILFDSATGALKAVIEAFALGMLRTGGISAVATRILAAPDADELAIIGSGKQALAQVAAVNVVRPLRRVRIFSPDAGHRAAFEQKLRSMSFGFDVTEAGSVEEAVDDAAIITLVTRARAPFLASSCVEDGVQRDAYQRRRCDRPGPRRV
jgi:ornithine cyclodeaminase